jgi:glutaredoxin
LQQIFLGLTVKEVDASSTEGKALIAQYGLEKAPSFVFDSNFDKTYAWGANTRIQGAFKKSGSSYVMLDEASGATYLLDAKKRAEMTEKTGVKTGDNKPQIDFYVMSYCPYGNQAEEGIEPVYQLLKETADFNPHYVVYSNYGGGGPQYCMDDASKYCSMHGAQEMTQGIREICVHKYLGDAAYFKFVLAMNQQCNAGNADSCWENVAKTLKLDTAKIKSCEADEGETIAASELELNKLLGVQGSPTVFVEGQPYGGGRTPADYAAALCAGFETAPDACSASSLAKLGTATPASTASAGGCG